MNESDESTLTPEEVKVQSHEDGNEKMQKLNSINSAESLDHENET